MAASIDPLKHFNITETVRFLITPVVLNRFIKKLRTNVITTVVVPYERNLSSGRVSGQCLARCTSIRCAN